MPKRIVTMYVCSRCKDEFIQTSDVISFAVKRQPGPELLLDLCVPCMTQPESMQSLVDMAYSEGTTPTVDLTCPECGRSDFATLAGLSQHRSRTHDVVSTFAASKATVGKVGNLLCPECEAVGVEYRCKMGQGLAAHRRAAHGVLSKAAEAAAEPPPAKRARPRKGG